MIKSDRAAIVLTFFCIAVLSFAGYPGIAGALAAIAAGVVSVVQS